MEKPKLSNAWYVLPLLLGVVGGFLGYFMIKDDDLEKATSIFVFGVGWTIIVAAVVYFMNRVITLGHF